MQKRTLIAKWTRSYDKWEIVLTSAGRSDRRSCMQLTLWSVREIEASDMTTCSASWALSLNFSSANDSTDKRMSVCLVFFAGTQKGQKEDYVCLLYDGPCLPDEASPFNVQDYRTYWKPFIFGTRYEYLCFVAREILSAYYIIVSKNRLSYAQQFLLVVLLPWKKRDYS